MTPGDTPGFTPGFLEQLRQCRRPLIAVVVMLMVLQALVSALAGARAAAMSANPFDAGVICHGAGGGPELPTDDPSGPGAARDLCCAFCAAAAPAFDEVKDRVKMSVQRKKLQTYLDELRKGAKIEKKI